MGFPPPPHNGPPPPPEQGGGFGPPQGFGPPPPPNDGYGPPPPPNDGYGYPQQGAEGYGYPQQGGGYGPPGPPGPAMPPGGGYGYPGGGYPGGGYPPPQPPRNNTKRNVWIAVGAVVVVGAIIGGIAATSGGGDDKPAAKNTSKVPSLSALPTTGLPTPTYSLPSDFPSMDLPTDFPSSSDEPEPSATDSEKMPYVVVDPGKCFNAPSMTHSITTVETVSCTSAHDAQSIANKTLTGTFTTEDEIEKKAFSLCESDATKHAPAGGDYYSYVLFPQLITYQLQGRDTVTCALTLNDGTNNKKLHSKLS